MFSDVCSSDYLFYLPSTYDYFNYILKYAVIINFFLEFNCIIPTFNYVNIKNIFLMMQNAKLYFSSQLLKLS